MVGLGIALYTDEHIDPNLALTLRRRGYDAVSCREAGRANQRISDELQLTYAAEHNQAILTYDGPDFIRLDHNWKRAGRQHAGIIVVPSSVNTFSELLRRVTWHLDAVDPQVQRDTLLWLA
jgi:predicted nuclease of predicted toxin-antitoxin system